MFCRFTHSCQIFEITSRSICSAVSLLFYTMGTIIAASSTTISSYVTGSVLLAVGSKGIPFLKDIIVADLKDLKWRGLVNGIMSSPYLITVWFAGLIVDAALKTNWRCGYGMFAIVMPVMVVPEIFVLYHFEHKAQRIVPKVEKSNISFWMIIGDAAIEIDAFSLLLLGLV